LAYQGEKRGSRRRARLPFAVRAVVAQHDQLGRLVRRVRHREESAHAEALEIASLEHLELELELARELLRLLGKVARGTDVAWQVAEGAREVGAVGRCLRLGERLLELRIGGERQRDVRKRRRIGLLLRL